MSELGQKVPSTPDQFQFRSNERHASRVVTYALTFFNSFGSLECASSTFLCAYSSDPCSRSINFGTLSNALSR